MRGRVVMAGILGFAIVFGVALWWFQTRAYYTEVEATAEIVVAGRSVPVAGFTGIDASTSPLKLRACFRAEDWPEGLAPAADAEPLTAPSWFECFDARRLADDLEAGRATAVLAADNVPYGFSLYVARYDDGRAYLWRQINRCGDAVFAGDPAPSDCPSPPPD